MPKGAVLKCPECGYKYTQVNEEEAWCAGRTTTGTIRHKVAMQMKGKT